MSTEPPGVRTRVLTTVALIGAFAWGAGLTTALADHYHTNCTGHGLVHGDSTGDSSFHSRAETGCGSGTRTCKILSYGSVRGGDNASGGTTCNAWSKDYGSYTECAGEARVYYANVYSEHDHNAHNPCY